MSSESDLKTIVYKLKTDFSVFDYSKSKPEDLLEQLKKAINYFNAPNKDVLIDRLDNLKWPISRVVSTDPNFTPTI